MSDLLVVEKGEAGTRLDLLLKNRFPTYSRTYFQQLIEKQLVLLNGECVKKRVQPKEGDEIEVEFALTQECQLEAEDIPLEILYEDEDLLVVNKAAGMVVHPGAGNPRGTFVNALLYHCQQLKNSGIRPGIVHRLDKDTSGVLLAAKKERVQELLVRLFAERKVKKEYVAITLGNPRERNITTFIGRNPERRQEMKVLEEKGKEAVTDVKTVGFDGKLAIVQLFPITGRTHQLRLHMKYVGTPIVGDPIYGNLPMNKKLQAPRLLLHAHKLAFVHPMTGQKMVIEAPLPEDLKKFIKTIHDNL